MGFFERVTVTTADLAEDAESQAIGPTERGDDVLVFTFTGTRTFFHLRRGMSRSDVAEGLRTLANLIEQDTET